MVVRRCPTLPHPPGCSTIGAVGLSFRVRYGTGRFPHAMAAVTLAPVPPRWGVVGNLVGHATVVVTLFCCANHCSTVPRVGGVVVGGPGSTVCCSGTA